MTPIKNDSMIKTNMRIETPFLNQIEKSFHYESQSGPGQLKLTN